MASAIFPLLKQDGYHITLNLHKRSLPVVMHNPYIDKIIIHDEKIPNEKLTEYWEELGKGYDKVINLSESIEGSLLKTEWKESYNWLKEKRHEVCNVNYYDRTLEIAGYGHIKGLSGELYFTKDEIKWAKKQIDKYRGKFIFMWSLSGSSLHKTYPYTEQIACSFLDKHPDAICFTVGDQLCQLLEWQHPRTKCKSGIWTIRQSMLMTKFVDLVIGSETGLLNAAGCWDTSKIVMLSHSSHENLSKYWKNVFPLHADVDCYPCHQMKYSLYDCELDKETEAPICMAKLSPYLILGCMEEIYKKWRYRQCVQPRLLQRCGIS